MEIKVLGTGCARCAELVARTGRALELVGLEGEVAEEHDPVAIAEAGVLATPALEVDGQVLVSGRVPEVADLADLLRARAAASG